MRARAGRAHKAAKRSIVAKKSANTSVSLGEVASVIRSKLSGPFRVTFDVIFRDKATYESAVSENIFTKRNLAKLYGVPLSRISSLYEVPMGNAIKFTMTRVLDPMFSTSDSHGAQQHAPLIGLRVRKIASRRRLSD